MGQGGRSASYTRPVSSAVASWANAARPRRALGDCGHGHFLHDSDEPVYLDDPVDNLNRGVP